MRYALALAAAALFSGCATVSHTTAVKPESYWKGIVVRHQEFVKAHLSLPDESLLPVLEGEVVPGMTREETRTLYGEATSIYVSPTGMMEVWFYETHYVGFDKAGRVVRFGWY